MSKKYISEQKQDLLLDALSCIDEDILARGLALRDGKAVTADAPKDTGAAAVTVPLYDLSAKPQKPPKPSLWRVLSVVAAACLLVLVIPLSLLLVGNFVMNYDGAKGEASGESLGGQTGILDGDAENVAPEGNPDGPHNSPEADDSNASVPKDPMEEPTEADTYAPMEEATDGSMESVPEPGTAFDPHEMVWSPATQEHPEADYSAQAHNGAHVNLIATFAGPVGSPISAEDERALQMVGQWLLSVCALDYGDHFPLFYESFVQETFIKEAVRHGQTYTNAIQHMDVVAGTLFPVEEVYLILHLEENTLLAGDELEDFRATKPAFETARGFDPELITAVRRIRVSGGIELNGFYLLDSVEEVLSEAFYIYEYEGKWYLDETLMDDDLSIDLLGTGEADTGFYRIKTTTGTVVAVDDVYLYLDTGDAFHIDGATVHNQTDGGEWHETVIRVGDTVTVNHYTLKMEGLTRTVDGVENEEWTLSTATEVHYFG